VDEPSVSTLVESPLWSVGILYVLLDSDSLLYCTREIDKGRELPEGESISCFLIRSLVNSAWTWAVRSCSKGAGGDWRKVAPEIQNELLHMRGP
jgi:hypothetical protein